MNNENIIDDKVKNVISIIKDMDLKNKLRLGVCMSSSTYTNLRYNKAHIHSIFDKRLKEIDNEFKKQEAESNELEQEWWQRYHENKNRVLEN